MHSMEFVKRQAQADAMLQENIAAMAKKGGVEFGFDAAPAKGDANLRRLLLMEAANQAMTNMLNPPEQADKPAKDDRRTVRGQEAAQEGQEPEIVEPDGIIIAAVETTPPADAKPVKEQKDAPAREAKPKGK
jgi:hypothetical protein